MTLYDIENELNQKNLNLEQIETLLEKAYEVQEKIDTNVMYAEESEDGDLDLCYLEQADINFVVKKLEELENLK